MRGTAALCVVALLASCQGEPPPDATTDATPPDTATDDTVAEADYNKQLELVDVTVYAANCKAELGLPPDTLEPMNCLDGVEIPVRVQGAVADAATYEALVAGEIGCDNPSWIGDGDPCANYSFIHTRQLSEDVVAVLFCRQRSMSSHLDRAARRAAHEADPSVETFEALYGFESLGLIWTNTKTGATCFFERVFETYGGYVTMPDDPTPPTWDQLPQPAPPDDVNPVYWEQGAQTLWKPPMLMAAEATCATCHDSGPFIRSGHVHGLDILPPQPTTTPYYMATNVGRIHQTRNMPRAISTTPIQGPDGDEPQVCTTCHRVGRGAGCDVFSRYYTGQTPQPSHHSALPFHTRVLMPPPSPTDVELDDDALATAWTERYQSHIDKLLCCCDDPEALGCRLQDITQTPLPAPVDGAGPGSCELW